MPTIPAAARLAIFWMHPSIQIVILCRVGFEISLDLSCKITMPCRPHFLNSFVVFERWLERRLGEIGHQFFGYFVLGGFIRFNDKEDDDEIDIRWKG